MDYQSLLLKQYLSRVNIALAPYDGYFESKEYEKLLIVKVNLEQAENYCRWLTNVANKELKKKRKRPVADYRLPTEVEWTDASIGGKKNPDEIVKPAIIPVTKVVVEKINRFLNILYKIKLRYLASPS